MHGRRFGSILELAVRANTGGTGQTFATEAGRTPPETIALRFKNDENGIYDRSTAATSKSGLISRHIESCNHSDDEAVSLPFHKSSFDIMKKIVEGKSRKELKLENISLNTIIDVHDMVVENHLKYDDKIRSKASKVWWDLMFPAYIFRKHVAMEKEEEEARTVFDERLLSYIDRFKLGMTVDNNAITFRKDYDGKKMNEIERSIEIEKVKITPEALNLNNVDESACINTGGKLGLILWFVLNRDYNALPFELDLSGCVIDIKILRYLGAIQNLKKLNLSGCIVKGIEGEHDRAISHEEFVDLEECDISGVELSEEIVSVLSRCKNLKKLSMDKCLVDSDVSFEPINDLTKLEDLDISKTTLSNEQLDVIFRHGGIITLNMRRCVVDKEYEFVLRGNNSGFMKNVVEFNCGRTRFGDTQLEMILMHEGLVKLCMKQCDLETDMVMRMKGGNGLIDLDLSENDMLSEEILAHISNECKKLERLNINGCDMVIDNGIDSYLMFGCLKCLYAANNKLSKEACERIFSLSSLESLDISDCGLVEGDLSGIEQMHKLTELCIGKNFIGEEDLSNVFKLKGLKALSMGDLHLFSEGSTDNKGITINGIKELSKLKVLDISNNLLSDSSVQEIFELSQLEELQIGSLKAASHCINIDKLQNLRRLYFISECFSKNDFKTLARLERLTELTLDSNSNYGFDIIRKVGCLNNNLEVLKLKCGRMTVEILDPVGQHGNLRRSLILAIGRLF